MYQTLYGSSVMYQTSYGIYVNVVTFFVKIAEMTMARLTNVYFSLVESQKSHVNTGWT